jgi:uncharacterized protein (DUF1501 family)
MSILNNVGYPNPILSHFRSSDIWHTASNHDDYYTSGWLGRYIDQLNEASSGIEIDEGLSLILKGEKRNGIATRSPSMLHENMNTPYFKNILGAQTEEHLSEHNLGYLYKTMIEANSSAKYIYEKTKTYKSKVEYPKNAFAKQLQTTAEFINSGLNTKVYYVSMAGFDTHVKQLNRHSKLLQMYSESMNSFINDLEMNNTFDDTLVLTFSEFGRRVDENASGGTDHGAANNVFIYGKNLKKQGFYNTGPSLLSLDTNNDIKYTIDFRSIYATILEKWLKVDSNLIIRNNFDTLNFI